MTNCLRCGRILKNPESVERKYGYVCFVKLFGKPERKIKIKTKDDPNQSKLFEEVINYEQRIRNERKENDRKDIQLELENFR